MTTTRSPTLEAGIFILFWYLLYYCAGGDFYYIFEEDFCKNYHSLSDDIYPHVLNPGIQNLSIMEKQRCHPLATPKPNADERKPVGGNHRPARYSQPYLGEINEGQPFCSEEVHPGSDCTSRSVDRNQVPRHRLDF